MPDPIAAALDALPEPNTGGKAHLIDVMFGDRPEVLEKILDARRRGRSFGAIAGALSTPERRLSSAAVRNWCQAQS